MGERYDLVIVGLGSGGVVAAELAATLGVRVAAVERAQVGGDCLWTGCVPSKALLAAAKVAHHVRTAHEFGITTGPPEVDRARVWDRIRSVQAEIAATDDNPEHFRALGVDVVFGDARLSSPTTVTVAGGSGDRVLETRYVLLATGSRPAAPEIEGLEAAGYLTSESLFALREPPPSFVTIGGGPIAVETAQAFTRLGIATTLLQQGPRILPRDEPGLVDRLAAALQHERVDLRLDVETSRVAVEGGRKVVYGTEAGTPRRWEADEILVAVGREPNVEGLGLEELGIGVTPDGVDVDRRGRTSVRTVYACGDVAGRFRFTHSAAYEAQRALRDMFFPGTGKVGAAVPWCTFTDPELAHAGMTEAEARAEHGDAIDVWHHDLAGNDRARADGTTAGAMVVITHKHRIVGAHVLAPAAGELIHELALAIAEGVTLSGLSQLVHVYPTISTSIARLSGDAALARVEKLRWLVKRR